jgi:integrase
MPPDRAGEHRDRKAPATLPPARRLWVRLREKGGKRRAMPCHHNLEEYLTGYLDGAELRGDPKGPLFRTIGRGTGKLTRTGLPQANAYAMIGRRAAAAGIATKLGNHSFRATGITAYLKNGAARWRRRRPWRTTPRPAPRSSTIAGATSSASMRSRGS